MQKCKSNVQFFGCPTLQVPILLHAIMHLPKDFSLLSLHCKTEKKTKKPSFIFFDANLSIWSAKKGFTYDEKKVKRILLFCIHTLT